MKRVWTLGALLLLSLPTRAAAGNLYVCDLHFQDDSGITGEFIVDGNQGEFVPGAARLYARPPAGHFLSIAVSTKLIADRFVVLQGQDGSQLSVDLLSNKVEAKTSNGPIRGKCTVF